MMEFSLDPQNGMPIYLQIVRQITYGIRTGLIPAEEQLPSVREMSKKLQVNPLTVAKAYLELEHEGLVATRWGRGTFVVEQIPRLSNEKTLKHLHELTDRFVAETAPLVSHPRELVKLIKERLRRRT